ncbi:MAG TPA: glycosyltransferase [Gemmatimonadales bacterium]|nr:glycosyltransferase [Gemmatimonadales bacterium]
MQHPLPLVVFSHLRWDFVFQRPQHLLSRIAARRRVLFIEEPIPDSTPARWEPSEPAAGVHVFSPHTPARSPGFSEEQLPILRGMVRDLMRQERATGGIAWLYTPLALPLLDVVRPAATVYDCMDELSLFLHAPPHLLAREEALLRRADVVFTGGPSLFQAKRERHANIHCFPSSVDAGHFRAARGEPADQAALPHPRLGFYGVIDERIDLAVIGALADRHPEWQIVMVGPVVKIDPATLPRRANIHWLGQRSYGELPDYLAGWDLCLLPFARNDATRFISPTKTLEYMARERPIVSTPITDVAVPYRDIVYLGESPPEFVAACEAALESSVTERARRALAMRQVLARTSWDATAAAMERLIEEACNRKELRSTCHPMQLPGAGRPLSS